MEVSDNFKITAEKNSIHNFKLKTAVACLLNKKYEDIRKCEGYRTSHVDIACSLHLVMFLKTICLYYRRRIQK